MPDDSNILSQDHRPAILRELDDFNTADVSDGILLGILKEQTEDTREDDREEPRERQERVKAEPAEPTVDHFPVLNSSIQSMRESQEIRDQELRREIQELRQQRAQEEQSRQQQNIDYDAPVSYGHLAPLQQAHNELRNFSFQQAWQNQYQRAQIEYLHFKTANPEFSVSPQELDRDFRRYVGNDIQKAAGVNWTGVFNQMHNQVAQPRMQAEIAQLRKENEELKKQTSRPKSTNAPQTQAISPALRSSGRAVQSHVGEYSDDVVNLPSFAKGRSFKSFGKELDRKGLIK